MYFKTSFSVGRKMSARMKKLKNGPYTETITKDFVDSNTDYQTGVKRKQLLIKNGFNEKNFAFLLEDHYLTIDDWLKIYNVEKIFGNERSKNSILNMSRKKYGCALEMRNTFKLINRMENYSAHIKIHCLQLRDCNCDVRSAVREITYKNKAKIASTNNLTDAKDNESPRELIGKIFRKDQIRVDDVNNKENKFSANLKTTLECKLQDSDNFNARFVHVKSWQRTLAPFSIWEFKFKHHLGNGVNLNKLWNIQCNNNSYTSDYVFIIETVGDRRASIRRNSDKTVNLGYSPVNILVEFKKQLKYLAKLEDENEFLTIGSTKRDESFEEDSELANIFQPDRNAKFTVDFDNIEYLDEPNPEAEYTLEYNKSLLTTSDAPRGLASLVKQFEAYGQNSTNVTEDDLGNLDLSSQEQEEIIDTVEDVLKDLFDDDSDSEKYDEDEN